VVRLLDPDIYGLYTGIGVYLGYFALGHLGIINGLGREFPYQMGRGNEEYGKQLSNSSFAVTLLLGLVSGFVFLLIAGYNLAIGKYLLGFTLLSYVIVAALNVFNTQFLPTLYRTNTDFEKLSRVNISFGWWNLVTVIFVWLLGFPGLLVRGILLAVIQFYLLFRHKPYPLKFKPIKDDLILLLKTGFPIYVVGQINPLWSTIVNNLIFALGGAKNFGLYALSNIVQTTVQMIPTSFGQVIYPRMSKMYGEGKAPKEIILLNLKPLVFQFFVMLCICIIGILLLPVVIPLILPKYVEGILPAQWILVVPVIYSFGAVNNIFNVTGKQKLYFISLITGAVVGTLFIYLKLQAGGFSLLTFPQGMILGRLIQQAMSLYFAFKVE
jgi:O-antigen/teichoic acid export membrane protein